MNTIKLYPCWVLAVLFFACEKRQNDAASNTENSLQQTTIVNRISDDPPLSSPANPANPVDSAGLLHNEAEDYILSHIGIDSTAFMEVSLAYIGNKYGSTVQDNTEQQINTILYPVGRPGSNPPQPGLIYFGGVNDFTVQDLHDAINSLSLGATAKARLNDLVTILTDSSARDIADFDVVKAAIINWENLVTTQFTGAARDRLLGAGSVARYSSYYWQVYNETIPDGTVTRGRGGFLRWLGWGLVGAADAIGFFVGGGGLSGVAVGAAGSFLGFKIFRARGWNP